MRSLIRVFTGRILVSQRYKGSSRRLGACIKRYIFLRGGGGWGWLIWSRTINNCVWVHEHLNEPEREKIYLWTCAQRRIRSAFAPAQFDKLLVCPAKIGCAGWSESSFGLRVRRYSLSHRGLIIITITIATTTTTTIIIIITYRSAATSERHV